LIIRGINDWRGTESVLEGGNLTSDD
jgi:hypothetical protein